MTFDYEFLPNTTDWLGACSRRSRRSATAAPPGVDQPDLYQAWSGFLTAPNREDWESIYTENLGRVACPT
jgi:hypothetical protein